MEINKENNEAYYLDYVEGNLSIEATNMLLSFFEVNPELKEDLEGFDEDLILSPIETATFDFDFLKQVEFETSTITSSNVEEFSIAFMEGGLSPVKQEELKRFLALAPNQSHLIAHETFQNLKLTPVVETIYPNKSELKKRLWATWSLDVRRMAVAAVVLILLGVSIFISLNIETNENSNVATVTKQTPDNDNQYSSQAEDVDEANLNSSQSTSESNDISPKEVGDDEAALSKDQTPSNKIANDELSDSASGKYKKEQNQEVENVKIAGIQIGDRTVSEQIESVPHRILGANKNFRLMEDFEIALVGKNQVKPGQVVEQNLANATNNLNKSSTNNSGKHSFSLKEFLTLKAKEKILKSKDRETRIKTTDFDLVANKLFNGKVKIEESTAVNEKATISYKGKLFKYKRVIQN